MQLCMVITHQCILETMSQYIAETAFKNLEFAVITLHYSAVIMGAMASQITSLIIVNSNVYSGADQRNMKAPRH